jgi:hypothetical protein
MNEKSDGPRDMRFGTHDSAEDVFFYPIFFLSLQGCFYLLFGKLENPRGLDTLPIGRCREAYRVEAFNRTLLRNECDKVFHPWNLAEDCSRASEKDEYGKNTCKRSVPETATAPVSN